MKETRAKKGYGMHIRHLQKSEKVVNSSGKSELVNSLAEMSYSESLEKHDGSV